MGKFKRRLLIILWVLVAFGLRIAGLFLGTEKAADTYGYFSAASRAQEEDARDEEADTEELLEGFAGTLGGASDASEDASDAEEQEVPEVLFNSGLLYAYTERLSDLMGLTGIEIEGVALGQLFLQAVWILLIIFALKLLWGGTAATVSGCVLAFSPEILNTCWQVSPENYYMLHWAVVLLLLAVFYQRTQKKGWYRSNPGELFLMFTGFLLGMLCIWNYISWILVLFAGYVVIRNHDALKERLWLQKNGEELLEKDQIMPAWTEGVILVMGALLGMYATLMKYTGLTGYAIGGQIVWWVRQYRALPGRCQGVEIQLIIWLAVALLFGCLCQKIVDKMVQVHRENQERKEAEQKKKETQKKKRQERKKKEGDWEDIGDSGAGKKKAEPEEQYVRAEDGRLVKLLDNPLPVPPRHVKKEISFDHAEAKDDFDFDFAVDEDNDFDL